MSTYTRSASLLLIILFISNYSLGQSASRSFGKNRIQYKPFDWSYFSTPNYDIYYYKDGLENARMAADIVEEDFDRITDIIGYSPYTKTKIFLYNSTSDLQQSNIGISDQNYTVGGQTTFFKSQVEIAYPGSVAAFKNDLSYYVARILINDMMFGGNLKDMVQNSFLLSLPEWFMDGAAMYVSQGWGIDMDDVIRDKFQNGKLKRISTIKGRDATLIGQSIWNFISEKYGRSNISNILNLTRIIRNEESSISSTLGTSFNRFLIDWKNYYTSMNEVIKESYVEPLANERLRQKNKKGYIYNKVKISPSGDYVAYSENYKGRFKVYVKRYSGTRKKVALRGGHKVINQKIDLNVPLLSWKDDRYLGIISVLHGKTYLWLYDVNRKSRSKREIKGFNQILDFDISDDGNSAVFSADHGGESDLYLMNLANNGIRQITRDAYDDLNPVFMPGSDAIAFASNRVSDTLKTVKIKANKLDENFNIFVYSPDTSRRVLKRISNTISKEIKPIPINQNEIIYLSDQKGIYNIYNYKVDQNVFNQVTNNIQSYQNYDVNISKGLLAYTAYYKGAEHLFLSKDFNPTQNNFTKPTRRQEIIQARVLAEKRSAKPDQRNIKDPIKEVKIQKDTLIHKTDTASLPKDTVKLAQKKPSDEIDTDDYQFESSPKREVKSDSVRKSILRTYTKPVKVVTVQGPFPYKSRFSASSVVSSFVVDPIRGWGLLLETEMTDMLENHKFYGGVLGFLDLKSNNFFGEYQYLKNRIDYKIRVDRKSYFIDRPDSETKQRYVLNKIEASASYPFSLTSRISISPFYAQSRYNDLDATSISGLNGSQNFKYTCYGGFKAEFVFDNSLISGLNIIEGTRLKIRFENYNGLRTGNVVAKGFNNINIDIRKYTKIHKEIILATRLTYGQFFGAEKQNYILGGMENSLFGTRSKDVPLNFIHNGDNRNVLFAEFVTPLRGFDYNKVHGSQVLLFNAELRFPIVSYFYKGPVSSNFFRNLQLVTFMDIGAAWDGKPPFTNDNTLNTEYVNQTPFKIKVKGFQNPWLTTYGGGLRTMLLGYFAKFDLGWGVENYIVNKPKLHISVGHDF